MNRTLGRLAILLLLLTSPYTMAANVLVISSYHAENRWTEDCLNGVKDTLEPKHDVTLFYMDTKRKPKSQYPKIAQDTLKVVESSKPDIVMLTDDNALNFLGQKISDQHIPVVFYGINNNPRVYFSDERLPNNVYGILERHLLIPLVRHINMISPLKHKKVLLLFDNSNTSKSIIEIDLKGSNNIIVDGTELHWEMVNDFDEWKAQVSSSIDNYDAIILDTWFTIENEKTKQVIPENEIIDWTGTHSPVPVFSVISRTVSKDKAVGAFVLRGYDQGKEAAEMVLMLLNGEKPKKFKTIKSGQFYLNQTNLEKFNLAVPEHLKTRSIYK